MSWLLGAAIVGGALGAKNTKAANAADRDAAELGAYQDQINYAQEQQSAYTHIENMIKDIDTLESSQAAMGAAMGKRGSGGSSQAIQQHQRGLLTRDIADIDRSIEIGGKLSDISQSSRYTQASNAASSRWLSWGASTIGSFGKALA